MRYQRRVHGHALLPEMHQYRPRGYTVFRGVTRSPLTSIFPSVAFQSWGPDMRFAAVPLPQGASWFATFRSGSHALARTCGRKDGQELRDVVEKLQDAFREWHAPIDTLLEGTTQVMAEPAQGSGFPWRFPWRGSGPVVAIGDAAFMYDPILAIGAGEAILDAQLLVSELSMLCEKGKREAEFAELLDSIWTAFNKKRALRIQGLSALSNLAGFLGQTRWCKSRDAAMALTPSAVKRAVFDWNIRQLGS